ncbi:MAG: hypothetical protein ABL940_04305 [Bacteroidia bacterium]
MKTIKPLLIIASALFLFFTLNSYSCKKIKKGTLEVKITTTISNTSTYYKAISVSNDNDKYYVANTEFNLEAENNYTVITGYFWPDKSPQALGYTRHDGDAESGYGKKYKYDTNAQGFTNKEDDNYSGKNGHWPSASSSSGSGSSSGSSGACPEGTWKGESCPGVPGSAVLTLNSNKKGSFSNDDCKGICSPAVFTFTYSVSGSTINFMYDAQQPVINCTGYAPASPPAPKNGSATFTCSGNTLTIKFGSTSNVYTK